MIKKHSKVTVIIVAILMFTSTWAGVFAADTDAPQNTEEDAPAAAEPTTEGTDSEGIDGGEVSTDQDVDAVEGEGTEELEEATEEPVEEVNPEDAVAVKAVAWKPTATAINTSAGVTITVNWSKPPASLLSNTQTVTGYKLIENVNGNDGAPVDKGNVFSEKFTNKAPGVYKYKIIAKVTESAGENTDSSTEGNPEETSEPEPIEIEGDYSATITVPVKPAAPASVEPLSGYKCIVISFNKGTADGFLIYRYKNAADFNNYKNPDKRIDPVNGKKYTKTVGTKVTWTNSLGVSLTQNYWYRIYAVNRINKAGSFNDGNVVKSNPVVIKGKGCVRPMYITLKLKKKRTLKALDSSKKKITLKKNTTITASGYGGGCYYFWAPNGHKYRMARSSAKKQKALYNGRKGYNYSDKEAELFVNQAKLKSKTNYLIWVSFYTQRLYVFTKKSNGTWKYYNDWDCATGKAATPSPTGFKAIGKKKPSHHGIKWWSSFSNPKSIANSLHGKRKGWILGLPQSHGCIRNEVANAKWIYKNCPKKTMVYNY